MKSVGKRGCVYLLGAAAVLTLNLNARAQLTRQAPTPPVVSVVVHGDQPGGVVPATLFGSFLEPIGTSINQGLVAQVFVNPSLEGGLWNHVNLENMFREQPGLIASSNSTGIPLPWEPLNKAAGNCYKLLVGDAANSWQSLELMGRPRYAHRPDAASLPARAADPRL